MKRVINLLLNLIYPPKCVFCRDMLEITTERAVCDNCRAEKKLLKDTLCCVRCGKPIVSFGEKQLCYNCLNKTYFYFKRIVSALEYSGDVRYSILRYKRNVLTAYAKVYAEYMYEIYKKELSDISFDFVVGVPEDKKRVFERGSNHIGVLCEKFSQMSGIEYLENCLKKVKATKKQSTLGYYDRLKNLDGCMRAVEPSRINGKTLLLIDDVCTTGATIEECAKELKLSGAKQIYALTVATTSNKKH